MLNNELSYFSVIKLFDVLFKSLYEFVEWIKNERETNLNSLKFYKKEKELETLN